MYTQYGPPDVLQLKEVARPELKENQVLVKVYAASVNALDYRCFERLSALGSLIELRFVNSVGTVLGADIAGRVESVGASVKQIQPGDEVFGVAAGSKGGSAGYACAAEDHLALKPSNQSFTAAAPVPVSPKTWKVWVLEHQAAKIAAGRRSSGKRSNIVLPGQS